MKLPGTEPEGLKQAKAALQRAKERHGVMSGTISSWYEVKFLGHIWDPGYKAPVAKNVVIPSDALSREPKRDNAELVHAIYQYLRKSEGDFSAVVAVDATWVQTVESFHKDGEWDVTEVRKRSERLRAFEPNEQEMWDEYAEQELV